MAKAYCCMFTTPQGSQSFEADTWGCLVGMLSRLIAAETKEGQCDLESTAKAMVEAYNAAKNYQRNVLGSRIKQAGLVIDVARCYLLGLTLDQTVALLKQEKGLKTSSSAVLRFWDKFKLLAIGKKGSFAAVGKGN